MAGGIGAIVAYLGPNSRSIGTLIPDVVIEEAHRDSLVITQHPVEKGAAITTMRSRRHHPSLSARASRTRLRGMRVRAASLPDVPRVAQKP